VAYWYNLDTKSVESDDTRGQNANVLGPYDTEAEAAAAIERTRENNERWDEEDREWDQRGAAPGWDDSDLED
jgi:hypothetical protein